MSGAFDLTGRVALVTGATGRLGPSLCRALARAGASVVVASRREDRAEAVARTLRADGAEALGVAFDVTDEDGAREACHTVLAKCGRLDVLVNNAGVATTKPVEALGVVDWNGVMAVNATGTFVCSKVFAAPMLEQGRGSVVNVASVYGVVAADQRLYGTSGRNSSVVYAAAKAAIVQITRYLAVYWAERGVRVNCVSPGGVADNQEPDFVARYSARVPLARMAQPDDVGGAVVFLASDAAAYVTGHNLVVDGGWTAW